MDDQDDARNAALFEAVIRIYLDMLLNQLLRDMRDWDAEAERAREAECPERR